MALFKKNPNEANYATGKKNFANIIKNTCRDERGEKRLVWRQWEEDFNNNSVVEVGFDEEALFIKDGHISEVLGEGTHVVETSNFPFFSRLRNAMTGGISRYPCYVIYVDKTVSMEINWGFGDLPVKDKTLNQVFKISGYGAYNVLAKNASVFVKKMVGAKIVDFEADEIRKYLNTRIVEKVKTTIKRTLDNEEILDVIGDLETFSEKIAPRLDEAFEEYGLMLENFAIEELEPEEGIREKYNELEWEVRKGDRLTDRDVNRMDKMGDERWQKYEMMQAMNSAASNQGGGGTAAAGMGMGMGMMAGGMMGQMMQPMMQQPMQQQYQQPMQQQYQQPMQQPMQQQYQQPPMQQAPPQAPPEDPVAALKKLKDMLDMGLIEQAEFDAKKSEIMSRM
jgi:membrane protease subunit (stomatin/prohibitin family)